MNLLFFATIALVFPLESIANSPATTSKKLSPARKQNMPLRKPANTASLIELKPLVHPSAVIIEPKIPLIIPPKPKGPTYFNLSKVQSKDQLTISFRSYDPHLKLNTTSPLIIQLFTDYPLQLDRSLIVGSAWPKGGTSLTVSFSKATPKIQNKIRGKASYTYCHDITHKCKTVLEPILFYFIP